MSSTDSLHDSGIFLDTTRPNIARIFNFMIGGTANFEVDRMAARHILSIFPALRKWVRLRHAFVQEAVQILLEEGFTQFLDIASGIPGQDHAYINLPEVRVIYSDINPVAVSYGASLLSGRSNAAYIFGDARQTEAILADQAIKRLIDPHQKVAIGLNSVQVFLQEEQCQTMALQLYDWAPAGSKLFIVLQTANNTGSQEAVEQFLALGRQTGFVMKFDLLDQLLGSLLPWRPIYLEPIEKFLGLPAGFITESDRANVDMAFYAGFFVKG